jgi:DNA-binding LacI/PurR family transcriptional regulator
MEIAKAATLSRERPSGIVRQYILTELRPKPGVTRVRLPSIRELSKQLEVGVSTVQSVYRELAEEGYIESTVGNGSYLLAEKLPLASPIQAALNINSRMMSEVWYQDIVSGMMTEVARQPMSVAITMLNCDSLDPDSIQQDFRQHLEGLDGAILFPSLAQKALVALLTETGRSYVTINPLTPSSTTNFVSPAYFDDAWRAGRAFAASGRKRILYLCQKSSGSPHRSTSARMRLGGLLAGFTPASASSEGPLHLSDQIAVGEADSISAEAGYEFAAKIYESPKKQQPDAVFCSGLPMAAGIVRFLNDRGLRVPEEVAVVAGSHLDRIPPDLPLVSNIGVSLQELGAAAVRMLCSRIAHDHGDYPGKFFPGNFTDCGTTTSAESQILSGNA